MGTPSCCGQSVEALTECTPAVSVFAVENSRDLEDHRSMGKPRYLEALAAEEESHGMANYVLGDASLSVATWHGASVAET